MNIPIDWLKGFIKINLSAEKLANELTLKGFLVEGIKKGVLDIEPTANRGDVLSVLGISRELAAILDQKITLPKIKLVEKNLGLSLEIEIAENEICPRYSFRIISGVKVGPSPKWLVERLEKSDIRTVSNIVDVTNYVMLELGQPLHAFDYDKLVDKKIIIRRAKSGEIVTTLDSKTHQLGPESIVIENHGQLIDLAGIMGGENSQVDSHTKTIILQAAIFNPVIIRKAAKSLRFSTDASYRYERGVDFAGTVPALDRATDLILKTAGGNCAEIVDLVLKSPEVKKISVSAHQINKLIGSDFTNSQVEKILKNLGFGIKKSDRNMIVQVPSWRINDINLWQDLAEEVARIYGYFRIPAKILSKSQPAKINEQFIIEQKLADLISGEGFLETVSYSFLSQKDLQAIGISSDNCLKIQNPLSSEFEILRPKLAPNLLKQLAKNPWISEIKMFEIGEIFSTKDENKEITIITSGPAKELTNIIKKIEIEFKINNLKYQLYSPKTELLKYFKIKKPIQVLEIDLAGIVQKAKLSDQKYQLPQKTVQFQPISKYPPAVRDLAFIIDKNISASKVRQEIKNSDQSVFIVELFDQFVSDKFGTNKKNLAFHIWFSAPNKTLSDSDVTKITAKIVANLAKKFSAKIRDF